MTDDIHSPDNPFDQLRNTNEQREESPGPAILVDDNMPLRRSFEVPSNATPEIQRMKIIADLFDEMDWNEQASTAWWLHFKYCHRE